MSVRTPPPTPGALPLVGHSPALLRDPLRLVQRARAAAPVTVARVGPHPVYLVNQAGAAREALLARAADFDKGLHLERLKAVIGNGLAVSAGAFHRRQRRLVRPAFQRDRIARYADLTGQLAAEAFDRWRDGQRVDLERVAYQLSVRIGLRTLFAAASDQRLETEVAEAMWRVIDRIALRVFDPTGLLARVPTPGNRRFDAALNRLNSVIDQVVADWSDQGGTDVLSTLMLAADGRTGARMPARQVRDEVMNMLFGGTESTAAVLCWAAHLLGADPVARQRLRTEARQVLGGRPAGHRDLARLGYTRRVVAETMRLYPPAPFIPRRALVDVALDGYLIPAGSDVLICLDALHRDPAAFPDPDRFDPDRWSSAAGYRDGPAGPGEPAAPGDGCPAGSTDATDPATPESFLPFGAGLRGCVGEPVAWATTVTLLATLADRWTLLPIPGRRVRRVVRTTIRPDRLPMTAHRADPA